MAIMQQHQVVRWTAVLIASLALACSAGDVNSPTTGAITQWVVDAITIPTTPSAATQAGFDLDGDGFPDNALGNVLAALQSAAGAGFTMQAAMTSGIASGAIVQLISVQSDDATLASDAAAAAHWYTGHATAGFTAGAHTINSSIAAGSFVGTLAAHDYTSSNPATTSTPVTVTLPITLFAGGTPIHLPLNGAHVQWHFSGTTGIASGEIQGSIRLQDLNTLFIPEMAQAINSAIQADTASSTAHALKSIFDQGGCAGAVAGDGMITICEVSSNALFQTLLAPDVHIYDAAGAYKPAATGTPNALSVGVGFTAVRTTF
jgi:hypothetical protein